jgi:hypothetical protein
MASDRRRLSSSISASSASTDSTVAANRPGARYAYDRSIAASLR